MRALLQRVSSARVDVAGECVGQINSGLLVFLGLDKGDSYVGAERLLEKLLAYRMFADDSGRMNNSVVDVSGAVLLVSQFTLSANTSKGLRPSFSSAMAPADAETLYEWTLQRLHELHPSVESGVFGADMQVGLVNDGPVTFLLTS